MKTNDCFKELAAFKTLEVIESCNTTEQLRVARRFADRCVKLYKGNELFEYNHWESFFRLTIDQRLEEIYDNLIERWENGSD